MSLLHNGPARNDHLNADVLQLEAHTTQNATNILQACPQMPSLETMHQIAASNPRAQAKFYLLMQELHFGQVQGFERLQIGRTSLVQPSIGSARHDWYASSLQPSITPSAADLTAPGEAQGRGFQHAHAKGHSRLGVTLSGLRKALLPGWT